MTIANKSFESAGAGPGLAAHWTVTINYAGDIVADFHLPDGPTSSERFIPGWSNDDYLTAITSGVAASFDAGLVATLPQYEAFGRWVDGTLKKYQSTIAGGTAAEFVGPSGTLTEDGFEQDWSNTPYLTVVTGSTIIDNLNTGWGNTSYLTTISGGVSALFEGGVAYEDFDPLQADLLFVVSPSTPNTLVSVGHGLTSNQKVTVLTTGIYPTGLAKNVIYYVNVVSADTFRLSSISGPGASVTISDYGTGDHTIHVDPAEFWTAVA